MKGRYRDVEQPRAGSWAADIFVGKTGFWRPAISQCIDRLYLNSIYSADPWISCQGSHSPVLELPKHCWVREAEKRNWPIYSFTLPLPCSLIKSEFIAKDNYPVLCKLAVYYSRWKKSLASRSQPFFFSPSRSTYPQWGQRNYAKNSNSQKRKGH